MGSVDVSIVVEGVEARAALCRIADYRRWPEASAAVRSVEMEEQPDGSSTSTWEVVFRGGLMRWTERDWLDLERLTHRFELLEGDPRDFDGTWTAEPREDGCVLHVLAEFDLGMPSLRHVLDPIAIEALEDAIEDVLRHLFAGRARFEDTTTAPLATEA